MKKLSLSRLVASVSLLIAVAAAVSSTPVSAQVITPLRVVRITSPPNHAVFFAPVDIPIFAYVGEGLDTPDQPGVSTTFTNVDFYAGTNFLGTGVSLGSMVRPPTIALYGTPIRRLGSVWCFVWTNPPPDA